jgi:hypothetical protein
MSKKPNSLLKPKRRQGGINELPEEGGAMLLDMLASDTAITRGRLMKVGAVTSAMQR